jgi:actin-related protein
LILDSGAYSTSAVPINDGYALQKSIIKYDIGGEYLTESLLNYIEKER